MALDFTVKRRGHDFLLNTGITDSVLKESYKKEYDFLSFFPKHNEFFVISRSMLCNVLDTCFDHFTESTLLNIAKLLDKNDDVIRDKIHEHSVSKHKQRTPKKSDSSEQPIKDQSIVREDQSIPLEQSIPQNTIAREQSLPRNTIAREQSIPQNQPNREQSIPQNQTNREQSIPRNSSVREQSMPQNPSVREQLIPQNTREQSMPRNTIVREQSIPQNPSVREQSIPQNPSVREQSIPHTEQNPLPQLHREATPIIHKKREHPSQRNRTTPDLNYEEEITKTEILKMFYTLKAQMDVMERYLHRMK
jgi:hypothetical protein